MSGIRVAVTGASGFIGSQIVCEAEASGIEVIRVNRQVADLGDQTAIAKAIEGARAVIHAAGRAHVFRPGRDEVARMYEVNAAGTANVAAAAAAAGAKRLVLLSSVAVYGPSGSFDESSPVRPEGGYAESKLAGERLAGEICERHGMDLVVLRLATVYGEGDRGNLFRLIRALDRRRFIWIGDGRNRKTLIHRDDAARASVLAASSSSRGGVYNVGAAPATMMEIVTAIAEALAVPLPRRKIPVAPMMAAAGALSRLPLAGRRARVLRDALQKWTSDNVYASDRFSRDYAFQARVSMRDGICREVVWYRATAGQ